ncbi:MAG: putative quinol monooxygenase [Cobetia sp.]|uniref:putative quinol monooxygenase n=1 Tax=Cobetia sp. TaxID=1873876 RepID=UPI00324241C8
MTQLTIIANIHAKPDQIEQVKAALLALVPITRAEEGCLGYTLHQNNDNPAHFTFHENWASRELWQQHMQSPHLEEYMAATEGAVSESTLHEMTAFD